MRQLKAFMKAKKWVCSKKCECLTINMWRCADLQNDYEFCGCDETKTADMGKAILSWFKNSPVYKSLTDEQKEQALADAQEIIEWAWDGIAPFYQAMKKGKTFAGYAREMWLDVDESGTCDSTIYEDEEAFIIYISAAGTIDCKYLALVARRGRTPSKELINKEAISDYLDWVTTSSVTYQFKDWDDEILKVGTVEKGQTPVAPTDLPPREGYRFTWWSPSVGAIEYDTTFVAQYVEDTPIKVTSISMESGDLLEIELGHTWTFEFSYEPANANDFSDVIIQDDDASYSETPTSSELTSYSNGTAIVSVTWLYVTPWNFWQVELYLDEDSCYKTVNVYKNCTVTIGVKDNIGWTVSESSLEMESWRYPDPQDNQIIFFKECYEGDTVTATPSQWYEFDHWERSNWDPVESSDVITDDCTINAVFSKRVTVTLQPKIYLPDTDEVIWQGWGTVSTQTVIVEGWTTISWNSWQTINVWGTTITATPGTGYEREEYECDTYEWGTPVTEDITINAFFKPETGAVDIYPEPYEAWSISGDAYSVPYWASISTSWTTLSFSLWESYLNEITFTLDTWYIFRWWFCKDNGEYVPLPETVTVIGSYDSLEIYAVCDEEVTLECKALEMETQEEVSGVIFNPSSVTFLNEEEVNARQLNLLSISLWNTTITATLPSNYTYTLDWNTKATCDYFTPSWSSWWDVCGYGVSDSGGSITINSYNPYINLNWHLDSAVFELDNSQATTPWAMSISQNWMPVFTGTIWNEYRIDLPYVSSSLTTDTDHIQIPSSLSGYVWYDDYETHKLVIDGTQVSSAISWTVQMDIIWGDPCYGGGEYETKLQTVTLTINLQ